MPPCTMGLEMPRDVVSNVEIGIGPERVWAGMWFVGCSGRGAVEQQGGAESGVGQWGKGIRGRSDGGRLGAPD